MKRTLLLTAALLAVAVPAAAQLPGMGAIRKGQEAKDKGQALKEAANSLTFSAEERLTIGREISAKLRNRFGVVQDAKVTKYVTLTGMTVAKNSAQPSLPWQFIVLDTDGINAYAAPGGFVHITRCALGFLQNEAELAGVLGHEIGHVIGDHTIAAIRKGNMLDLGANLTRSQVLSAVANKVYEMTFENAFDRGDENDADKTGAMAAGKAGYSATAMTAFLTRLGERNKGNPDRNGLFSSHPDLQQRNDKIVSVAKSAKLTAAALVAPRYAANISYKPIPMASIATVAPPAASAAPAAEKKGLSLGGVRSAVSGGSQKNATATTASAGARGVTKDRDAAGGPNKAAVTVRVTDAELATFKAGIG